VISSFFQGIYTH